MNRPLSLNPRSPSSRLNLDWPAAQVSWATSQETARPAAVAGLMLELFVRNLARSRRFYAALGFHAAGGTERWVEFTRGAHRLLLVQPERTRWAFAGEPDNTPRTNLRLAVPDLEALWERAKAAGARVLVPLGEPGVGAPEFMVADPDGFGLCFARATTAAAA
jgi:catechol 2,3-dioxygenase-like lactoylglutathione lyase family enzyme